MLYRSAEYVHSKVGQEIAPGGLSNKIRLDANSRPHNPMINTGAILMSSLFGRNKSRVGNFFHFSTYWTLWPSIRLPQSDTTWWWVNYVNSVVLSIQAQRVSVLIMLLSWLKGFRLFILKIVLIKVVECHLRINDSLESQVYCLE